MTPLQRKVALAKWRDKNFVYHSSESHNDASLFRERMREYAQPHGKRTLSQIVQDKIKRNA